MREERLRRITERPGEEENEGEVHLVGNGNTKVPDGKEPDGTLKPEVKVKSEVEYKEVGGSDFTGVTVEAWTSFNR